jgi:hypothetical protein
MQIPPDLKAVLRRLRLSGILATLADRDNYGARD